MKASDDAEVPKAIQFQLIPVSDNPDKPAIGEVIERKIVEGVILSIGRQVIKDGQPVIKGNKASSEDNIWFNSKVVSRTHAELWMKDHQLYIRDIGSSSGTFLNKMRLSPSGKESRPYAIKQGDELQFGIDFRGKTEDIYKRVLVKIGFHDQSWIKSSRNNANHIKFRSALKSLLSATNPYSTLKTNDSADDEENSTDCCICIGPIAPYQALFVAPCSHCFHFKCVSQMIISSPMFQCPLCRQVANLTASVSMESLIEKDEAKEETTENEKLNNDSIGVSYAYVPDKRISLIEGRNSLVNNAVEVENSEMDQMNHGERKRSSSMQESRKPSLSMKLAELLGRQMQSYVQSSSNHRNDESNTQNSIPTKLTPRSETTHFTRPLISDDSKIDSSESILEL